MTAGLALPSAILSGVDHTVRALIGHRLRSERERLGLSQTAVATAMGVGKLALLNYEHGRRALRVEHLPSLEQLGFDVHFIATGRILPTLLA